MSCEELLIGGYELRADTGIHDVAIKQRAIHRRGIVQVVSQYLQRDVAQVFRGDHIEQSHRLRALLGRCLLQELLDHLPVTSAGDQELNGLRLVNAQLLSQRLGLRIGVEGSHILITDRILLQQAFSVLLFLLSGHLSRDGTIHRRHDIQLHAACVTRMLIQRDRHLAILTEGDLAIPKDTLLAGPYQHIALTG